MGSRGGLSPLGSSASPSCRLWMSRPHRLSPGGTGTCSSTGHRHAGQTGATYGAASCPCLSRLSSSWMTTSAALTRRPSSAQPSSSTSGTRGPQVRHQSCMPAKLCGQTLIGKRPSGEACMCTKLGRAMPCTLLHDDWQLAEGACHVSKSCCFSCKGPSPGVRTHSCQLGCDNKLCRWGRAGRHQTRPPGRLSPWAAHQSIHGREGA